MTFRETRLRPEKAMKISPSSKKCMWKDVHGIPTISEETRRLK
jgi:hypothetical protein